MDGDYQTWHLHNKVTGIYNIIDLLSRDACFSTVIVFTRYIHMNQSVDVSLFFPDFLFILWTTISYFSLFYRGSFVWWVRSRSIWSVGQATVACWPRIIRGSIHQSHASAQRTILNGNDFPSQISQLGLYCNSEFYPQWSLISFITHLPEHLNSIALNYSCLYRFVIRNRWISLQSFICLDSHLTLHIYWITNMSVFIESNYSHETVDGSWEVFVVLL